MKSREYQPQSLEHVNPIHKNIVVINWFMGNCCNFSCPYCSAKLHNGTFKWPLFDDVKKGIDKICHHFTGSGKTLYFDFTGGEVSLNKDLPRIIDYLKQKECWVGLITNGSRDLNYWQNIKGKIDHISITFHPQFTKKEHFLAVVDLLHRDVTTHVNIMMQPGFFDSCKWIGRELTTCMKNISLSYQPLVRELGYDHHIIDYSKEQIDEIVALEKRNELLWTRKTKSCRGKMRLTSGDELADEISTPELLATGRSNWTGWQCWAGLEQLVIDEDGSIFRAWCRQDLIGNLYDDTIDFPREPVLCRTDNCSCQLDLATTKKKGSLRGDSFRSEPPVYIKRELPVNKADWFICSDRSEGGSSRAEILEASGGGINARLLTRTSQLDCYYAFAGFPWGPDKGVNTIGVEIEMDLARGKILSVQFPLGTQTDHDFYYMEILGDGEKCYHVYFQDLRQGLFGEKTEWNFDYLKEIRFFNEYIKNDISIRIKRISLLSVRNEEDSHS